jgi:glycosyltransferase involved in cell wall biosynthesis
MKVFLINLNVGSGIEAVGDTIKKWIQELPVELVEYKDQTKEGSTMSRLLEEHPDIIVINEIFSRIISPVLFYKLAFPNTKVILFSHSQKYFITPNEPDNQHVLLMDLLRLTDIIYTLDASQNKILQKENLKFCPSDPKIFHNEIPWKARPNLFCIIGGIYPLKVHLDFLNLAHYIPTQIDIYGEVLEKFTTSKYRMAFALAASQNLEKKEKIPQAEVGKVLNQYKYIIFPHHGSETFCMMLQQAIMCGTIPIVLNDDSGKDFNPSWIEWASNMCYVTNNIKTLIENLTLIAKDEEDYTPISQFISKEITKRFGYKTFKNDFQTLLKQ